MQAGFSAGITAFRSDNYPLYGNVSWDEYEQRLARYQLNDLCYTNLQYDEINTLALRLRQQNSLYVNTRTIYNPVSRLVNIYADKVYPAALDLENLSTGAIPIQGDAAHIKAVIQLFRWSNWNGSKQTFVRNGEKLGDSFIRIVDDIQAKRVLLETVSPQKVRYCKKDGAGNIKELWLEYYETEDDRPALRGKGKAPSKTYVVTEVFNGYDDTVTIYHDSEEVDKYDNPFGFVPFVHVKATDEDKLYGTVRWNNSRTKIDQANSQASLLNDQMRKAIIPYIVTIGAQLAPGSLTRSATTMDEVLNIPIPIGGDAKTLVPSVDIASGLNLIESQLDEIREDNPELFLFQLKDMNISPSGVALRQFYDLAVSKIQGAMGVYDDGLQKAIQMAMTIGGVNGYQNFESFTLDSFNRGDLNFRIKQREVITDELTQEKKIDFLIASGAPQSGIWDAMNIGKEQQTAWKKENEEVNTAALDASLQRLASQGGAQNAPRMSTPNGEGGN